MKKNTAISNFLSKRAFGLYHGLEEKRWKIRLQSAGVLKAGEIFTYTKRNELQTLYELAAKCPEGSQALEIGSHFGASSCYIAAGLKQVDGHLFCVDTWRNETMPEGAQDTLAEFKKNTYGVKDCITIVQKASKDIRKEDFNTPLSLVFIDGDHGYAAVKRDFETIKDWLSEEGIIAFHDFSSTCFEGVTRTVGEALASGEWLLLGKVASLAWIKRAKWKQPTWL